MTQDKVALIIPQVHAVALAVAEPFAVSALILLHPTAVTVWLETVFPYVDEIVFVYVSLMIVGADTAACRN